MVLEIKVSVTYTPLLSRPCSPEIVCLSSSLECHLGTQVITSSRVHDGENAPEGSTDLVTLRDMLAPVGKHEKVNTTYALAGLKMDLLRNSG